MEDGTAFLSLAIKFHISVHAKEILYWLPTTQHVKDWSEERKVRRLPWLRYLLKIGTSSLPVNTLHWPVQLMLQSVPADGHANKAWFKAHKPAQRVMGLG